MCEHKWIDDGEFNYLAERFWLEKEYGYFPFFLQDKCLMCENCGSEKVTTRYIVIDDNTPVPFWFDYDNSYIKGREGEILKLRNKMFPDYPNPNLKNINTTTPTKIKTIIIER